jgi:hypothetical protein
LSAIQITGGIAVAVVLTVLAYALVIRREQLRRGATDAELQRALPGDDLVPDPRYGYTHAISIRAAPRDVWPWLVQIGYGRAGWYSHDWLHRLMGIAGSVDDERASAKRIIPTLQDLKTGDVVEIAPGMGFTVAAIEPEHVLVLHSRVDTGKWEALAADAPLPEKYLISSWVWFLEGTEGDGTRMIVRVRSDGNAGLLSALSAGIPNELGSLVMQPKTLRTIRQRAEANAR